MTYQMDERMAFDLIARFVRGVFMHEFQETWHQDGVRTMDPHSGETI